MSAYFITLAPERQEAGFGRWGTDVKSQGAEFDSRLWRGRLFSFESYEVRLE